MIVARVRGRPPPNCHDVDATGGPSPLSTPFYLTDRQFRQRPRGCSGILLGRCAAISPLPREDSPIVGAGTLADDRAGAISATGDGEGILKVGLAHLVAAALVSGASCADASATALATMETRTSARGGLIVARPDGAWAATWITRTMSWAAAWTGGDDAGS
jgi:hypothetical protein